MQPCQPSDDRVSGLTQASTLVKYQAFTIGINLYIVTGLRRRKEYLLHKLKSRHCTISHHTTLILATYLEMLPSVESGHVILVKQEIQPFYTY